MTQKPAQLAKQIPDSIVWFAVALPVPKKKKDRRIRVGKNAVVDVLWPRYAASKQGVIAGSKTSGRCVTIIIIVVLLLSFVAVVIWLRKKKSPDPKPTLHTQIVLQRREAS
jgi:hypothetical protein